MANVKDPNILEIAEICKSVSTPFEYAKNCGLSWHRNLDRRMACLHEYIDVVLFVVKIYSKKSLQNSNKVL